jgi:CHAD domain-containing protein
VQTATENERKYTVPKNFALPSLAGAADAETHDLDATYFDTDDLRLARNRRTLRRRSGGSDAGWHLKTPGDGTSRTEHRLPLDGDAVPEELRAEVRAIVRQKPLQPVVRLRTRRVETPLRDGDGRTLALIAQDQVTAEVDGRRERWQEVEVELVDGDEKVLETVERQLLKAGAKRSAAPSKLARALGDRLDHKPEAQRKISPVLAYAREQRDAIQAYDSGVRHGDPEAVHKMRVGTRRLRSTLKTYRRSFPPAQVDALKAELKWLAGLLGEVRDGQVLERKLLDAVQQEGPEFAPVAAKIREHLDAKIENGRQALERELNGDRYLRLLDAIDDLVDPDDRGEPKPIKRARKVLARADRKLDEATLTGEDEPLHEARKGYKQARYALEVFQPRVGKPAVRFAGKLSDLQDVLGAHQDSVVAREILRDLARDADDAFPYGILHARQEQVGRDTMGDLPGVLRPVRRRKARRWLK